MDRTNKRRLCIAISLTGIVLLLLIEIFGVEFLFGESFSDTLIYLVEMTLTRFIGGIIFLSMLINLEYRVLNPSKAPFLKNLLLCLPPFLIALNNFPISSILRGNAVIDGSPAMIFLLLAECLCIGFFEEMAFRGVIFLGILKKERHSRTRAFVAIVLSSVIFGLVHLVNIFQGSSPSAVLLQIGYSSLIGAMCAVMLLKTGNIWLSVIVHGLFNFCGAIVPTFGHGEIWDTFTVIFTFVLSVAVTVYVVVLFLKTDMKKTDELYFRQDIPF